MVDPIPKGAGVEELGGGLPRIPVAHLALRSSELLGWDRGKQWVGEKR